LEKTKAALDDFFSSTISLIPTWLSMLKSTRFLTLLIMVAVLVWAWKFSGLSDAQAQIVSIVGGLLGANFEWVKTIGKKYEVAQVTTPAMVDQVPQPEQPKPLPSAYDAPLDIEAYVKGIGGSLQDQYDACRRIISNYNLLQIHPSVRLTVAAQVVDKAVSLARSLWPSIAGMNSSGAAFYRAPEPADFKDYGATQLFNKAVRDAMPGCQYIPEGAAVLVDDFEELYSFRANLTLLEGKPVRWYEPDGKTPRIKAIYTLASMGLSAVA
jgi:hypothetical protein